MDDLLTLDEAALLIPGADAGTLLRRIRQGKLGATRPGKAYLTTRADVQRLLDECRVVPKVRACGGVKIAPLGSSSTVLATAALDSALAQASARRTTR